MDTKNLTILCIFIIVIVASASYLFVSSSKTTEITVISSNELANGDTFTIKLTSEGKPLASKSVNVTLVNEGGGENIQELTTNDAGEASFTLGGVADGKYSVKCTYNGEFGYSKSQYDTTLTVKTPVAESSTASSGPYVIASFVCGDGGHMVYYSDGSYKFYDRNWNYENSGYGSPDEFQC